MIGGKRRQEPSLPRDEDQVLAHVIRTLKMFEIHSHSIKYLSQCPSILGQFIALLSAAFTLVVPSWADFTSQPKILNQSIFTNEWNAPMYPRVIGLAADGGFISAGYTTYHRMAYATKTDANGHEVWSHFVELTDKDQFKGFNSEYVGSVIMPDGNIFLCGSMPRAPGKPRPGLVTHLNAQGAVLSEQLLLPKDSSTKIVADIADCLLWGDSVAVLGRITQWTENRIRTYDRHDQYWLLILDSTGAVQWEKLFDLPKGLSAAGTLEMAVAGTHLILSATDGRKTDLMRVDSKGLIVAETTMDGQFLIVRNAAFNDEVQIFENGYTEWPDKSGDRPHSLVSLDGGLSEVKRVEGGPIKFAARVTYRLADGSLVLFGSDLSGAAGKSSVVHVDGQLKTEKRLTISYTQLLAPVTDEGSIWAVMHSPNTNVFVAATSTSSSIPPHQVIGNRTFDEKGNDITQLNSVALSHVRIESK